VRLSEGLKMIFEYKTEGLSTGTSIDFLSVYPKEQELLYPPLTRIKLEEQVIITDDNLWESEGILGKDEIFAQKEEIL
jgi:hypothetical protein